MDHDIPVAQTLFETPVILSLLALTAPFPVAVLKHFAARKKSGYPELRLASFGITWFFLTLSVDSSVIPL